MPLPAKTEIVLTLSRACSRWRVGPLATEFQLVFRTAETLAPLAPFPADADAGSAPGAAVEPWRSLRASGLSQSWTRVWPVTSPPRAWIFRSRPMRFGGFAVGAKGRDGAGCSGSTRPAGAGATFTQAVGGAASELHAHHRVADAAFGAALSPDALRTIEAGFAQVHSS